MITQLNLANVICLSLHDSLDNYLQLLTNQHQFSGSILVSQQGKILFKKGYGMASYEHQVTNKSQTKFRIASVTKQFTAAAIVRLEEKRLLALQDPISKFINDFPNGDNITIYHLLTHTSGIANYTDFDEYWQTAVIEKSHEQTIAQFKNKPAYFMPGKKVQYNNTGYVLLAYIVELVTQKPFITFLTKEFFEPIGMHNTGFASQKGVISDEASGYTKENNMLIHADKIDMMQQSGAGFLYSTIDDLYLWSQALYDRTIISEKIFTALSTSYVPIHMKNWDAFYGYGFFIDKICNKKRIFHPGGIKGFRSILNIFPEQNIVIIILSNFDFVEYATFDTIIKKIVNNNFA